MNVYLIAADALLLLHALFVLFVVVGLVLIVLGGVCHWAWVRDPWFRLAHLGAIAFVVLQSWAGRICPLTSWEMALRARAGQEVYQGSFISYWVGRLLYYDAPLWVFALCYTAFAALVVACWWWVRPQPFTHSGRPPRH
jgi:hypothetical protein